MDIQIHQWRELDAQRRQKLLRRSETDMESATATVGPIIEDVRTRGDDALREYGRRFDRCSINSITVEKREFEEAHMRLDSAVKAALDYAIENVLNYHRTQQPRAGEAHEVRPGILVREMPLPIPSAGLYVPRGRGSFPSMLYMLAVPAVVAGVKNISIATPPGPDGKVDDACLYAATKLGIDTIHKMGGAQAIAAFAYGTESVSPVPKVVGPGSMFVAAAKRFLSALIDPGLPAGPSESIIIADNSADPRLVAWDLCIEAEHGSDSSAILITDDMNFATAVKAEILAHVEDVPEPRRGFLRDVFSGYGGIIVTVDLCSAFELANEFATEHLQLQTSDPHGHLSMVKNAGEVLLGPGVPFTIANYAVGANAVLPTGGRAKTWSAVSVRDFIKYSSVVEVKDHAYPEIARHCEVLADYEGFPGHRLALSKRRQMKDKG